ncbi:putative porin [Colwellia sp. Arc7-635]|uniref:putative porin n=1 Tax=Colwellia sp. Arc7-635 TaxID=2497879 RepID=UPI000F85299B|nr:putative porin [Colwellia sp. Arc7-635]AZQ86108.1 putative porin [Colwellia sp. Arc7-635]
MKKSTLLLGLSLLSSSVFANNYNNQVDFNYLNIDDFNVINLEGTHYFDSVTTNNTAWAEAAFMGRNNSASVGYTNFDSDAYSLSLGGDYYHENIFVGLDVTYVDVDGGSSDTNVAGELGYFFAKNWLVSVSANDESFSDSVALNTKYIATLSGGAFFNFEASYLNDHKDFTAAADYYWTARSSVGLNLSTEEGYDFGIEAQHFFSPTISARIAYIALSNDDAVSVGVTGRF